MYPGAVFFPRPLYTNLEGFKMPLIRQTILQKKENETRVLATHQKAVAVLNHKTSQPSYEDMTRDTKKLPRHIQYLREKLCMYLENKRDNHTLEMDRFFQEGLLTYITYRFTGSSF